MADMTIVQIATTSFAFVGAVLGVINTWHGLDKSRIKLKILPAHAIPFGGMDERLRFCIEITNLSSFPVTINDAGVLFHGTKHRAAIVSPVFLDGGTNWPRRLEPRSAITVYSQIPRSENGKKIKIAYATTQCGHTQTGNSPALHQIAAAT